MTRSEARRRAVEHIATGSGVIAASTAANAGLVHLGEKKGLDKPFRALKGRKLRPGHVAVAAGKTAAHTIGASGVPLALYGGYNLARPQEYVRRVNVKRDVVKPTMRRATGRDTLDSLKSTLQEQLLGKSLTAVEQDKLVARKKKGRKLSLAGAGLGVTALGLRAPEAARALQRVPRLGGVKGLAGLARREPAATKASNAVGTVALGTGSVGALNYAAQQKLEARQVGKALPVAPWQRPKELREAKSRRTHARANRDLVIGGLAAASVPAAIPYMNRGIDVAVGRAKVDPRFAKYPVPWDKVRIPEVKPRALGINRMIPVSLAGNAPGPVGRVFRNPKTVAAASLGLGAPLLVHNFREASRANREYEAQREAFKRSRVKKSLYEGVVSGLGRVRVVERPRPGLVSVYDSRDVKRIMHESRVTPVPKRKAKGAVVPVNKPSVAQGAPEQLELFKADDAFLREYRTRISPEAEVGYGTLRGLRNRERAGAVGMGAGSAVGAAGVAHVAVRGNKRLAALMAVPSAAAGVGAFGAANRAERLQGKMDKIKRKAFERAEAGQYGRGRVRKADGDEPVATIRRKHVQGAAMAGVGGGALVAGLSSPRLVSAYANNRSRKYAAQRDAELARYARFHPESRTKIKADNAAKRVYSAQMKALKRRTGFKPRALALTAGYSVATPLLWNGTREMFEKADQHDVDAFMGGSLLGAAAYQGTGYAMHPWQYKQESRLKKDPAFKEAFMSHAKKHFGTDKRGNAILPPKGDPRWKAFHRSYPKTDQVMHMGRVSVPVHQYKRVMSRLQGGKSQIVATSAAAAAAGLGAAALNRKIDPVDKRPYNVGKALAPVPAFRAPKGILKPLGSTIRKPSVRSSYVGTSRTGSKFTVRGTVR